MLHHIGAQVVADLVGVPVGGGQQPLHAVGGVLAGVLGQLPTFLPTHVTEQPTQIRQRPPPWLSPSKPWRDPGVQRLQPRRPRLYFLDLCCRPVGVRHGPSPSLALGAAGTIPAGGREPYRIKASAAGVLGEWDEKAKFAVEAFAAGGCSACLNQA